MAKEAILSVSLKDYMSQIQDLKAELLGLEKGSDAYEKKANEVREMQTKLNDAMNVGKEKSKALEGSYNAIAQEMAKLKKEWRETNDEARRDELGKQINGLNDKLKGMDASIGVFNRNVGDYSNQFILAMQQMGISLGGVEKGFAIASTAGKGFKATLDLISSHPLVVAAVVIIGAIVLIFQKLRDAIGENEELSNRLAVAFSAFQPILDAFTNGIAILADGLVSLIEWFSKLWVNLTDESTTAGKIFINLLKWWSKGMATWYKALVVIFQNVLKGFTAIPKAIGDGLNWILKKFDNVFSAIDKVVSGALDIIGKGVAQFMRGLASVLSSIGLDDWANGVNAAANKVAAGIKTAYRGLKGFAKGAIDTWSSSWDIIDKGADVAMGWINKLEQLHQNFISNVGKRAKESIKLKEQEINIEKKLRQEQILTAQSEAKQAKLRDDIAKETDPKKKIELEKQLRNEIETTGKRQVNLAKEQLALAEKRASLTPNSKEDNENLERLRANVSRTEAAYIGSMARVDKQITRQNASAAKAAEVRSKKEIAEAEKANKEKEKKAKEYVQNVNKLLSDIGTEATTKVNEIKSNEEMYASAGLLSPEILRNYANERYNIIKESVQQQINELDKALKSEEITEEQRASLAMRQNNLIIQLEIEKNKNITELNKIWLDENKKTYDEDVKNYEYANAKKTKEYTDKFATDYVDISDKYLQGEITYTEYEERMEELQDAFNQDEMTREIEHLQELLDAKAKYLEDVRNQFGEESDEYLNIKREYDNKELELEKKKTEQRQKIADLNVKNDQKLKDKKKKIQSEQLKAYESFSNGMQDLLGEDNKAAKAFAISDAIINTWKGASEVLKEGPTLYGGGPWGTAAMYANMAGVIATGLANVKNIISEKKDSGGSSSSTTATALSNAAVQPILDETQDTLGMYSINANQNATKVYVTESDITDVQNRVSVRENESTF